MQAVVVRAFGGPEALEVVEAPTPVPGPEEVLVRVAAATVNPTDLMQASGAYVHFGAAAPAEQVGLGVDFAGTVEAVGEDVRTVAPGAEVIGLQERIDVSLGAQADHVVVDEWALAPAPAGVSPQQAATLPLNGLTAAQALDELALDPGQWLLVTGAAGAVGAFAIQLGVLYGLRVIAQGSPADEELLRGLGAELFVSREQPLGQTVRSLVPGGAHGVVDTANLAVGAMDAVRHGGAFVSLLNGAPQSRRAIRTTNLAYHADRKLLGVLSGLAGAGLLALPVAETFALGEVRRAHERLAAGGVRGRLVLIP
jgi:NADPH2:quinone reductase